MKGPGAPLNLIYRTSARPVVVLKGSTGAHLSSASISANGRQGAVPRVEAVRRSSWLKMPRPGRGYASAGEHSRLFPFLVGVEAGSIACPSDLH